MIELLVVVAILAILMAILLPALRRARETSRSISCMSNQRQISILMFGFRADHDVLLPPVGHGMGWAGDTNGDGLPDGFGGSGYAGPAWSWHDYLRYEMRGVFSQKADASSFVDVGDAVYGQPLLSNTNGTDMHTWYPSGLFKYSEGSIFNCPASLPAPPPSTGSGRCDYNSIANGMPNYHPAFDEQLSWARRVTVNVSKPQQRILIMDAGGNDNPSMDVSRWSLDGDRYPGGVAYTVINPGPLSWGAQSAGTMVTPRHMGGSNVAFLDGHVEHYANIHANAKFWGSYSHHYGSRPWCWYDQDSGEPFTD